ncbi:MAG: ATP-binding protein [Runella zeae]
MHNYTFYGTKTKADEVIQFVNHILTVNLELEKQNRRKTPVCIWGRHGIGKTEIVEAIAKERNFDFAYIAPAQFEEMGDLLGMPSVENGRTVFRSPEWVPTEAGPGILLIDDVNRADERILRGIMQLLQNFELVSWKLPPLWQIILTANPDGGDYSVTPMDDAMLTRMLHISLEFDVKEWAKWAEKSKIDPRGINFVLLYPEIVTGNRTTPRTLVQFFDTIKDIDDLYGNLPLVQLLADSCLDTNTVTSFINFVNNNLGELISPEEILNTKNFERVVLSPLKEIIFKETIRVDIIATICTRLINYLTINNLKLTKEQLENVKSFIKMEFIPNDIRLTMAQDLVAFGNPSLKMLLTDPEISKFILRKI